MKLAFEDEFPGMARIISSNARVSSLSRQSPSIVEPPKPRQSPEPKTKPLLILGIQRQRIPSDIGVGDTVERILSKMGGDQFKWVMARLGVDCGCGSRQEWLNRVYPYE